MSETQETTSKRPTHRIYSVTGDDENAYWTRIGAAWKHKDGKGFSLDLELLPAKSSRLVMRMVAEKEGTLPGQDIS